MVHLQGKHALTSLVHFNEGLPSGSIKTHLHNLILIENSTIIMNFQVGAEPSTKIFPAW